MLGLVGMQVPQTVAWLLLGNILHFACGLVVEIPTELLKSNILLPLQHQPRLGVWFFRTPPSSTGLSFNARRKSTIWSRESPQKDTPMHRCQTVSGHPGANPERGNCHRWDAGANG